MYMFQETFQHLFLRLRTNYGRISTNAIFTDFVLNIKFLVNSPNGKAKLSRRQRAIVYFLGEVFNRTLVVAGGNQMSSV